MSDAGEETPVNEVRDVAIAVITYNNADTLPALLASLPAALDGLSHEVVVVDNASTDHTLAAVAEYPGIAAIDIGRNAGYAAGINVAAAVARPAHALLVCNADMRFRPGAVPRLLAALDEPGVGIAVPREIGPHGRRENSLRREPSVGRALGDALLGGRLAGRLRVGETVVGDRLYEEGRTADWASGAVHLISDVCLSTTGPWDESFFLYSEETDFDLRARDAGFRLVYVPDAAFEHDGGDMFTSPALWSLRAVNRVVLYRRRHGRSRSWAFWAAVVLHEGLRAARGEVHRAALSALLRYARTRQVPTRPAPRPSQEVAGSWDR